MSELAPRLSQKVVFATVAWVLGQLPLPLALALAPHDGLSGVSPGLNLPDWLFGLIWTIIYPALGIATCHAWVHRKKPGAGEALVLFALCFLILLSFLPITAVAHDQRVTAMIDVLGLASSYAAAWAYRRVDLRAGAWMSPLLVWMPITTLLKFATL